MESVGVLTECNYHDKYFMDSSIVAWWNTDERANQCQKKKHEYNKKNAYFFFHTVCEDTKRQDM